MADFICLAMASQYTENNQQEQQQQQQQQQPTSFRRSLGTSTLFGRRSSRSATSTTPPASTVTRPTSDSSIIAETTTHIRIVPSIENPSRSLVFSIIERDLEVGRVIKIGRFTDRSSIQNHISFKSKVVSRSHCEVWLNNEGKVQLKDTRSSSGTFVNHVRLSPANTESRPVEIRDGDLVQLGVDYQGGYEEIYRSVKMRFEVNRSDQPRPVSYSMSAFNNLRNMTSLPNTESPCEVEVEECCICLYALAPFQALFVAPCSHSYHFRCIRPLFDSYPGFQCPICRTYSDLDASVAMEADEVIEKFGLRKSPAPIQQPVIAESEEDTEDILVEEDDDDRNVSNSSMAPTNAINLNPAAVPLCPEPPLSTTLVACTTSLSGIISSPTHPNSTHEEVSSSSRDAANAGDHRAPIFFEQDNVIPQASSPVSRNNTSNLVEKIKMAFSSNHERSRLKKRNNNMSGSSGNSSDEDTSLASSPPSSPRTAALQPILSRQSTQYNPLDGILEEVTGASNTAML